MLHGEEAARRASLVSGPFQARPSAYVEPADHDDLRLLLRWAREEAVPLIPRAGGTGMPGGNLGPHVIVDLNVLAGSTEISPLPGGRFRVGASAVTAALESAAGAAGSFLPFLPSSARWCRIGGLVANNGAGARTFRYGPVAASLEEVEGYFPWGEPFRVGAGSAVPEPFEALRASLLRDLGPDPSGWPAVRKNASGYGLDRFLRSGDPCQLLAGSEGTLVLITRVVLRATRLPPARALAVLAANSPAQLTEIALGAQALRTETCEFMGRRLIEMARLGEGAEIGPLADGAYALVLVEVAGSEDEVSGTLAAVRELGDRSGTRGLVGRDPATIERLWDLRHAASPTIAREADRGRISTQFIEDSVVPPDRLGDYLEGLDRILDAQGLDAVVFGHAGDGNVHVNPLLDVDNSDWPRQVRSTLHDVTELVRSLGGTLTGEHGDGRLRAPYLADIWPRPLVDAFQQVKHAFDPTGILNPGVILPTDGQDPLEGFVPRARAYPR